MRINANNLIALAALLAAGLFITGCERATMPAPEVAEESSQDIPESAWVLTTDDELDLAGEETPYDRQSLEQIVDEIASDLSRGHAEILDNAEETQRALDRIPEIFTNCEASSADEMTCPVVIEEVDGVFDLTLSIPDGEFVRLLHDDDLLPMEMGYLGDTHEAPFPSVGEDVWVVVDTQGFSDGFAIRLNEGRYSPLTMEQFVAMMETDERWESDVESIAGVICLWTNIGPHTLICT